MKKKDRLEYEKSMVKIDNLENKFVLIQLYAGFGNKIFDCIIGMYLKINFGYTIYYVDTVSFHTKKNDPFIYEIFEKLKNEFIFITDNEGDYIKYYLKYKLFNPQINKLSQANSYFNNNNNKIRLRTTAIYNLVFDMYNSFDEKTKQIFTVNVNLINPEIKSYSKTNYATIHIRYGDKLFLGIKNNNNNFITFPIYTPEYYYEQIKIIKKMKIPIVILTDSFETVKHFILEKYGLLNDPDIFLPNIPFIDSFYLLMNSLYIVMSHSTFSYSAYLLSGVNFIEKPRTYVFCTAKEFYTIYKPADLFISKDWKIYQDKKYILNFDQELIKKMYEFDKLNK